MSAVANFLIDACCHQDKKKFVDEYFEKINAEVKYEKKIAQLMCLTGLKEEYIKEKTDFYNISGIVELAKEGSLDYKTMTRKKESSCLKK